MAPCATTSEGYATEADLNGLGGRVTELAIQHAQCSAAMSQRTSDMERRAGEQREDVVKLFSAMDLVKGELAQLHSVVAAHKGQLIGVGAALSILIPVLTALALKLLKLG